MIVKASDFVGGSWENPDGKFGDYESRGKNDEVDVRENVKEKELLGGWVVRKNALVVCHREGGERKLSYFVYKERVHNDESYGGVDRK